MIEQDTGVTRPQTRHLIVIGASAGGIDALLTLVASLPATLGAAIVVAQHLDPTRKSHLGELLGRRSPLPVVTVAERTRLLPGTIHVVPADCDVAIDDHHLGLYKEGRGLSRPSIDRLMSTAAHVFGDALIAVILSGNGNDGAAGAHAVKAYGGTVVLQNPQTAQFPAMPAAVSPATADIVADLEAIGPLLGELVSDALEQPTSAEPRELDAFLDFVRDRTGLDFSAYKQATIMRRLKRRMTAVGAATVRDYQRYVARHADELQRLVTSFLIKVTRFYRDAEFFDHLRDTLLPRLLAEARERGELRIWSAGCATGEEAYTLAMLITDLQAGDPDPLPVRIFATDVAVDAVEFARRGLYSEAALAGLPPDFIARHFQRIDGLYEVQRDVRGRVVFGEHDLGRRAPFPRIDLVLCRNVLIYFTPDLQRRCLQLFAFSLRSGGYLALGKAESVSPLPEIFAVEQPRLKVFRRVGDLAPLPPDQFLEVASVGRAAPSHRPVPWRYAPAAPQPPMPAVLTNWAVPVLDELTTGIVIVDRDYDVRAINIAARRLLGIRTVSLGEDLIHRVDPAMMSPLRAMIAQALAGERSTVNIRVPRDIVDGERDLIVASTPLKTDEHAPGIDSVLIEVAEVTALARLQRQTMADFQGITAAHDALAAQIGEAAAELRALRQANQIMAAEQSRLHAENQHLQLATEEAQAATEEIETLNEELQATNEELETLNEELQATVEELTTTNDELQARSVELTAANISLQDQHRQRAAERARLAVILANISDPVLVRDEAREVILTNDAYVRIFGETAEFEPEGSSGAAMPEADWPQRRGDSGAAFTMQFTVIGEDGARHWFEASGQRVPGLAEEQWEIIVFRDRTEQSRRELSEEFLATASHELRTPLTSLSGSLQLLRRRMQAERLDARHVELTSRAIEQARRIERHLGELTDVTRLRGGKLQLVMEPVDAAAFLRRVVEATAHLAPDQPIRLETPSTAVMLAVDPHRLEQVMFNLISNAARHAPDSPHLDLRLRPEPAAIVIDVQDYGPGIPEDKLPNIFTRFFQGAGSASAGAGLGLGLFIAREIVQAHGGELTVESTLGAGTTFHVRLPVAAAADPAPR